MTDPAAILTAWDWGEPVAARPITSGLINTSYEVVAGGAVVGVLQRLNTGIFGPEVHQDIDGLTRVLRRKGVGAPRLVHTRAGQLWHVHDDEIWRVLSVVGARTIERVTTPAQARSAGRLVRRFHAALADTPWTFHHVRPGVHDTPRHMATLTDALRDHPDHRLAADVAPLARAVLDAWGRWRADTPDDLPLRIVHGDLKISNVRFDDDDGAVALIDLDTLAWGTLDAELGDALRSWCGTAGEDVPEATFDAAICAAALEGYAEPAPWAPSEAEWRAVLPGARRIALELAARFAADALRERYFGWDASRFPAAGEHNLLRARGQWSLAQAIDRALPTLTLPTL